MIDKTEKFQITLTWLQWALVYSAISQALSVCHPDNVLKLSEINTTIDKEVKILRRLS